MNEVSVNEHYRLEQNDFFIRKTLSRYLLSSVLAMVSVYIGSLIDTILVGVYLGEDGLAAMSLIGPVYLVFYTVGATIGIGGSVSASRALGREQLDDYRRTFTLSTELMAIAAALMLALGYGFVRPVMKLLCGSAEGVCAQMAETYYRFYVPGGVMTMLAYIPLYFLRVEGKPKTSSGLFTMSAVLNIILSWLLISPVGNMGIAGVSLATSVSMGSVAVFGFILLFRGRTELKFVKGAFAKAALREILIAGVPNGVSNLLESARILLVNMLLIYSCSAMMLTCFTVIRNINEILNAVVIGISSAIIPLAGVFFGEHDYSDARLTVDRTMKLGLIITTGLTVLVCVFSEPLFRLFGVNDPAIIAEGRWAVPLACCGLVAAHANNLYSGYLTAVNREGLSSLIVALRLFILLAVFAVALAFTIGSKGVWLSFSLAEFASFGVYVLIRNSLMKKRPSLDRYLLDTDDENVSEVSFSVKNDVNEIVEASRKISVFCEDNEVDLRRSMKAGLAIEEILTFLLNHCLGEDKENYVAVLVCLQDGGVLIRFRYVGQAFNPLDYYRNNEDSEELAEELLGLKLLTKSASSIAYQQVLGTNNLSLTF